jgi:GNAT superfamily N-acetyltransferase
MLEFMLLRGGNSGASKSRLAVARGDVARKMTMRWSKERYLISTDAADCDIDTVHAFLSHDSTWAKGIPRETVERALHHSLCFSVLHENALVGFARVISDHATVAYVGDVFVLPAHRGKGISKWLMECIRAHPDLQELRRWMLATADAHGLYAKFGFTSLSAPDRWMEIHDPNIYQR